MMCVRSRLEMVSVLRASLPRLPSDRAVHVRGSSSTGRLPLVRMVTQIPFSSSSVPPAGTTSGEIPETSSSLAVYTQVAE